MYTNGAGITFTGKYRKYSYIDKHGKKVEVQEPIIWTPPSKHQKKVAEFKEQIERLVNERKIAPKAGNSLYKIIKQDKRKFKKYHWYITHSLSSIEVANFEYTKDKILFEIKVIACALADTALVEEDTVKKELFEELKNCVASIICKSVSTWEDDLRSIDMTDNWIEKFKKGYKSLIEQMVEEDKNR